MFKKVLIALDFSGPAMELFNSLADLCRLGLEELLLVHAIRVELGAQDGIHPIQQKFLEKVRTKKEELEEEGLRVNVEVPLGAPAEEIKRLAVEKEMDLILIGSVGESSAVRELFLGSTVADVVRIALVPVLVEKYILSGQTAQRIPIFKEKLASLLLPTDFSASAESVYAKMLGIAHILHEVTLLHVVDRGETLEAIKNAEHEAVSRLKEWEARFRQKGVTTRYLVLNGPPSSQILSTAEQEKATLIAISRRGTSRIANLFIGGTADQVVRRSKCPVLLFGK
ncbi:MAG: universal stress protein [Bacillota bacterium]